MAKTSQDHLPNLDTLFEHLAEAVYLIDPETSNIV